MKTEASPCYPFDSPGMYEIHVLGRIDERWSDFLGGMMICVSEPRDEEDEYVTVLTGRLPDQAALNGVLNTLYDRHHTLRYLAVQDAE